MPDREDEDDNSREPVRSRDGRFAPSTRRTRDRARPVDRSHVVQAALLAELGRFEVRDLHDPRPGRGELLVRVQACGVCGSDLRIFRHGHPRIRLPQVLGHEIVGTVVGTGRDANGFRPGDRVAVMPKVPCGNCLYCRRGRGNLCAEGGSFGYQLPGGFAEYVVVPEAAVNQDVVLPLPAGFDTEEAILIEPLACCLRSHLRGEGAQDECVVVIGGGPVGTIHGRLARHRNAALVILVERSEGRLASADRRTFHVVIDSQREEPVEAVRRHSDGRGADHVIVACSSREAQVQALAMVAKGGRVDFFAGLPPGAEPIALDTNRLHYQEVTIRSTHGSTADDCREALGLLASGELVLGDIVTGRYALSHIQEAFDALERQEVSKAVVKPMEARE
jgi:L-iditol 2-dehydrogenase